MNLSIAWVPPVPAPTCGYKALYRAKGQTTYTEISASGTTATVVLSAPACYEGLVKSDYCSGNTASGMPFGVNAYGEFSVAVVLNDSGEAEVTISSTYANPYDLMVTGTFDATANLMTTQYPFSNITQSSNALIPIDQIRELKNESKYTPYEAEKQFYIISNADKLSRESTNAFLKLLEGGEFILNSGETKLSFSVHPISQYTQL